MIGNIRNILTGDIRTLLKFWMIGWLILIMGRVALICLFLSVDELLSQGQFMGLAIWNAIRFDSQTLAYIAILPTLALIFKSFLKRGQWIYSFLKYYYSVIYTLLAGLTLGDLSFYKNFGEHYNITVFDAVNEGFTSLLQAFWEEYPVIIMMLLLIAVFASVWYIPISKKRDKRHKIAIVIAQISVWIVFIVIAMRGSFTEFPLQIEDLIVSPSQQLNDCVPNAVYSMKKAWKEKSQAYNFDSPETYLQRFNFTTEEEAWEALGKQDKSLFATLKKGQSLSKHPNVVIILSESWSGWLCDMALQSKYKSELLCGMEHHLTSDLLFRNFQSVENATIGTIETVSIATPFPRVYMSQYRYVPLETSLALPFNKSGYTTNFLSGMDEAWENVGEGLRRQGFDNIIGKYELLSDHPEYTFNSVGIYDHMLMQSLFEKLSASIDKQQMFLVMTTTNHPPFVYPSNIDLPELPGTFYDSSAFEGSNEVKEKYIHGFQYANKSMAGFMERLKASPLADNTIVVIMGDHNVRSVLCYGDGNGDVPQKWLWAVPLYIYLPPALRGTEDGSYLCDTDKYGDHYDLVPTLAPFAFDAGIPYLAVGKDLLCDSLNKTNTYSANVNKLLCEPEYRASAQHAADARRLLLTLYFRNIYTQN